VSAMRVLREVAAVAFADMDDIWADGPGGQPVLRPWRDIPPAARRTIQTIKVKHRRVDGSGDEVYEVEEIEVRHHSKMDALDKLCRHLGLTKDGAALKGLLALLAGREEGGGSPAALGQADDAESGQAPASRYNPYR
jgi:hypothetical protein